METISHERDAIGRRAEHPPALLPQELLLPETPGLRDLLTEAYEEEKQKLVDRGVHPDLVTAMARSKVEARPFA